MEKNRPYRVMLSQVVQGVEIHFNYDKRLHLFISSLFNDFCRGETRPEIKPLTFDLSIVKNPPTLSPNAVRVIKAPYVTYYRNGRKTFFISKDGSITYLNPVARKVKGLFKEDVLCDPISLFTLISAPFMEMLKFHGLYAIHSAALYGNGKGYLFSGESGCGKTTTSLSLVSRGFKYVSDDFVLLEETNGEIIAHSLHNTFNLDRDLSERFSEVVRIVRKDTLTPYTRGKVSVNISQIIPDSYIPHLRPNIIFFTKITSNRKSNIHPLGQMEVCRRLLKQTILAVDPEISKNQLNTIGKLVRQTRGFELLCGRDIYEEPERIVSFINKASLPTC